MRTRAATCQSSCGVAEHKRAGAAAAPKHGETRGAREHSKDGEDKRKAKRKQEHIVRVRRARG
jgi:hypothetical protein